MNPKTSLLAAVLLAATLAPSWVMADTGSAAFDQSVHDLGVRLQALNGATTWTSNLIDGVDINNYVAGLGVDTAAPGASADYSDLASGTVDPLRTFNGYLAYLGQRMRVDAGSAGPALTGATGSERFDRYVEEINYRLETLRHATESTGF